MKIKIVCILFVVSLTIKAQKVDLDREYVKTKYIELPTNPINDITKRTFSFTSNDIKTEDAIALYGYERINNGGAIDASLMYEPIKITKIDIKEFIIENKDKEGNVTSITKKYQPIVDYNTSAIFHYFNNVSGKEKSRNLGGREQFIGEKYTKYKEAHRFAKLNTQVLRETLQDEFAVISSGFIHKFLNANFGYTPTSINELFWILDSESNPEYEGHKKALVQIKMLLAKIETNTDVRQLEGEVQKIVDYFDSVIPKFQNDKKKHRKMKYASYYNAAKLFYQIDMPDKAIEYATKLIENDYDKNDGDRIIKKSNRLKSAFINNNINTRHFDVETIDNRVFETPVTPEVVVIKEEIIKEPKPITKLLLTGNVKIDNTITENLLNEIELMITIDSRAFFPFKGKFLKKNNKVYAKIVHPLYTYKNKYDTISVFKFKNEIIGANYNGHDIDFVFDKRNLIKKIRAQNYSNLDYNVWRNSDAKIIKAENYYNNKIRTNNSITYKNNKLETILVDRRRTSNDKVLMTLIENSDKKHRSTKKEFYKKIKADTEYFDLFLESPSKLITNKKTTYKSKHRIKPATLQKTLFFLNTGKTRRIEEKSLYYSSSEKTEIETETTHVYKYQKQKLAQNIMSAKNLWKPELSFKRIFNYVNLTKRSANILEYEWRIGEYGFNDKDELIFISRDGKHKKKENGSWTQWRYNSY